MTVPTQEPRRLLDPGSDGPRGIRELLESAAFDSPSPVQLGRLSARLGDLLTAPPPAPTAASEATSTPPAPAPEAASVAVQGGASLLTKVLVAAGAVAIGAGGFQAGRLYEAGKEKPPPAVVVPVQPDAPPVESPVAPPPPALVEAAPPSSPEPAIAAPRPSSPRPVAPVAPVAKAAPLPSDEPGLLDAALRAMRDGRFARALEITSEHRRAHPNGVLIQEREVIAIEALVRLGRDAEARAAADRFRAAFPTSGHLLRVDSLLRPDSPGEGRP